MDYNLQLLNIKFAPLVILVQRYVTTKLEVVFLSSLYGSIWTSLRSAAHGTLFVPRTRLELGKRAFAVAAPAAWNSLPDDVRSAPTLDKFKQCLKTHLFIQSYYS